jgi:hypothetical protein
MLQALLQYPITRPINLGRWFNLLIGLGASIWVAVITIVNIAAVGYESAPITYNVFNVSNSLWYERLLPSSWRPQSCSCAPSTIRLGEG